eukprot:CAMPEP_0196814516 /NCGR_PEP_ID=MMETSP1362-20130617/43776_1 /TAXON_ID=163516 /ORGANISM="Leptocylindrus danicus, Strain CCMP1856" /LENGTH=94 /DNA_ID=CAMNT_0042191153 /DNA_START=223 /DNA_END=507 /DNA_ORIENTATION=-
MPSSQESRSKSDSSSSKRHSLQRAASCPIKSSSSSKIDKSSSKSSSSSKKSSNKLTEVAIRNFNAEAKLRGSRASEQEYVPRTPHPLLVEKYKK